MKPPFTRRIPGRGIMVGAAAIILLSLYFLVDPADTWWMPKCPTFTLLGFSCPGCGSQRLLHALLHGDIPGAWDANAFLLLSLPYIFLLFLTFLFPSKFPRLDKTLQSAPSIALFLTCACIWTILRNFLGI